MRKDSSWHLADDDELETHREQQRPRGRLRLLIANAIKGTVVAPLLACNPKGDYETETLTGQDTTTGIGTDSGTAGTTGVTSSTSGATQGDGTTAASTSSSTGGTGGTTEATGGTGGTTEATGGTGGTADTGSGTSGGGAAAPDAPEPDEVKATKPAGPAETPPR